MAIELKVYQIGDSYRVTVLVIIIFSLENLTSWELQIE